MSVHDVFIPLTKVGRGILDQRAIVGSSSASRSERKEAKRQAALLEQKFKEDATALARFFRGEPAGADAASAEKGLRAIFREIRDVVQVHLDYDAAARAIATQAVDFTADRFIGIFQKEAAKSPLRRHLDSFGALYAVLAVVAVYFGIRLYERVPVYEAVETRAELLAGIDVIEKVARYDDWAGAHVRRGGWLLGPLLWPIKPTEAEIGFGVTALSMVLGVHDYAKQEGLICGSTIPDFQTDEAIAAEVDLARQIESYAAANPEPQEAPLLALAAMQEVFPCASQ